jgi:anaerobic magnesium-protoporphyrin IX monomethyl ester cyclase
LESNASERGTDSGNVANSTLNVSMSVEAETVSRSNEQGVHEPKSADSLNSAGLDPVKLVNSEEITSVNDVGSKTGQLANKEGIDILFFFPPFMKSESYGGRKVSEERGHLPPLGMIQLAAVCLEKGFSCEVIDPVVMDLSKDGVLDKIGQLNPKVIGVNALTPTFHKSVDIATAIRQRFPDILLVLGGTKPTLAPKDVLDNHDIFDIGVIGEGEVTIIELLNFFKGHDYNRLQVLENIEDIASILGIVYRKKSDQKEIVYTGKRPFIDLDTLPFPARHLLPMDKYIPLPIQSKRLPVVHMMVSRGCPFNCSFCCTPFTWGRDVRFRSPRNVVDEIKHVMKEYGAREISFWDDTFTANAKWLTELCNIIHDEKIDIIWSCFGRVNNMTQELAKTMKRGGCWEIFYGIESVNQDSLNVIRKGLTPKMVKDAVKATQDAGIEVRGLFMLGLPKETPETAQKTIDFAKELNVDYAQFTVTTPHKGTDLYSVARQYGMFAEEDDSKWSQNEAVFVPNGYRDQKELQLMVRSAYRQFYLRPKYVLGRIMSMKSKDDLKQYFDGFKLLVPFVVDSMSGNKAKV